MKHKKPYKWCFISALHHIFSILGIKIFQKFRCMFFKMVYNLKCRQLGYIISWHGSCLNKRTHKHRHTHKEIVVTFIESKQAVTRPLCTSTWGGGWANLHSVSLRVHLFRWNSRHTSSVSHRESLALAAAARFNTAGVTIAITVSVLFERRGEYGEVYFFVCNYCNYITTTINEHNFGVW